MSLRNPLGDLRLQVASVLDQYVGCNFCTAEVTLQQAFDAATDSWPNQSWIMFRCSTCENSNHLQLRNDAVSEGYLDGAPGPCFIVKRVVSVPKLSVKCAETGITIKNLNLTWSVPAR